MKNDILVSVIVPIYNCEKYLKRCLDSIKGQDYSLIEVILVDDGSTDLSADICKDYAKSDSRFRYIYQENSGPDIARKTGTVNASGECLLYVDSDDYISKETLSILMGEMNKSSADIVCAQIVRFNEDKVWQDTNTVKERIILNENRDIMKAFFEDEILIGSYCAKLIKKELMQGYSFIKDGLIGEDITAAISFFERANRVVVIPDKLYHYFWNGSSISHSKYSDRHAVSLRNYIDQRDIHLEKKIIPEQRICGFFAGYEMAVATAMGRRGRYFADTGMILREDLRSHWEKIRNDSQTPMYMKICILMFILTPRVFVGMYRVFFLLTGR